MQFKRPLNVAKTRKTGIPTWVNSFQFLRANKLGYVVDGTIVRIAPLSVLADEESQRRKLAEEQALSGDLKVVTDGEGNEHRAHAVILAMGSAYREIGLPDEKRLVYNLQRRSKVFAKPL